jgi:hypothetical protein
MPFEICNEFPDRDELGAEGLHLELDVHLSLDYREHTDEDAIKLLIDHIEGCDGYRYYLIHIGQPSRAWCVHFEAVCCQDTTGKMCKGVYRTVDTKSFCLSIGSRHIENSQLQRRYQRIQDYPCKGRVHGFINRRHDWIYLDISHADCHPRPDDINDTIPVAPIPTEVKRFIASQITPRRLTSSDLYETVVERFGYVVNYGQVQNLWKESFVALSRWMKTSCDQAACSWKGSVKVPIVKR